MKDNNSNQVLLSVLGVAILVVAVVGVSFAAFTFSQTGEVVNRITTGTISMSYSEPENGITLTNAMPMNDATGMALENTNEYFDFSVSATINGSGSTTINYAITAVTEPGSTLTDDYVKVYLTNMASDADTQILAPTVVSSLPTTSSDASGAPDDQYILEDGTFTTNSTNEYRLRMWVADNYAVTGSSETYTLRVNVYGRAEAQ